MNIPEPKLVCMKTYWSFGGGVNSVAGYLLGVESGMVPGDPVNGFEAVFVNHGCDWPETYEYVATFAQRYPLTVLTPNVEGFSNLYDYCWQKQIIPPLQKVGKWCTDKFKLRTIYSYVQTPCFMCIGFATEEASRAKINTVAGVENRWPLLEAGMSRGDCVKLIKKHGLRVPPKSGCWFCRNQRPVGWKSLRRKHAELYCKAVKLEERNNERRRRNNLHEIYLFPDAPVAAVVQEGQRFLFREAEYPPCQCGL